MKKILAFLLLASLRQRVYEFSNAYEAHYFALQFEGTVDIVGNKYIVII